MDIGIRNVTKFYGEVQALNEIDLTITPGIHGLLGPNGAGKTTLMRILATILDADRGEIRWGAALDWKRPGAIKGKIGYLPQHFGMYRYLRVEEALRGVGLLKDIPEKEEKEQVELAMERANLTEYAKRKVGQLSGGMLRRLGIAQAILGEPPLLIMDEPTVGLDPAEQIHFRKLIRDYDNGQRIVLISSHIVKDVENLCNIVSIMHRGKVLVTGHTQEIRAIANKYVKEVLMSEEAFRALEKTHAVINFTPADSGYRVRYLTNDAMQESESRASLEDSYTYIIQKNQGL
jgi:ABC-2 type transport system ATP-binding protein